MPFEEKSREVKNVLDDPRTQLRDCENNLYSPLEEKNLEFNDRFCTCSRRQVLVLLLLSLSSLSMAQSTSLFPPFYPKIAEEKGTSASVYGLVLGTNCLVMFLVTPIIGKHMKAIGVKFAFASGMFSDGVCCISSGFLDEMPPGTIFISMSVTIRIIHALGHAAVITSSFTIIVIEFPQSVAKVYGLTRSLLNVGFLLGPIVGGALYQMDKYRLPFFVLGSIQCFAAFMSLFLHPKYDYAVYESEKHGDHSLSIFSILRIPSIWIPFGGFVLATLTNGFLSVTLEPHILRQFSLTPICMGLFFGIKDGISGLSSPFWGWLCDKTNLKMLLAICALISGCSLLLMNPPSFISFNPSLWLVIVALSLNGFGNSGEQVAAAIDSMSKTIEHSYNSDDLGTHGFIAGMWSSLSGLGRFLSRALSGILVDHLGHGGVTMIVSGMNIVMAFLVMAYVCLNNDNAKGRNERTDSFRITKSCEFHQSQTYAASL